MKEKLKKINIMKKYVLDKNNWDNSMLNRKNFTSNGFVGGGRLGKDITLNMLKLMMKIITAL